VPACLSLTEAQRRIQACESSSLISMSEVVRATEGEIRPVESSTTRHFALFPKAVCRGASGWG
jgi:DNA-binding IscR family transcriptional regulator